MENLAHMTIVGGGIMGRGIAYSGAVSGHEVRVVDASPDALDAARSWIVCELDTGISRGKVTADEASSALRRVTYSEDLTSSCSDSKIVIEAVVESLSIKHEVLTRAEKVAPSGSILATNTSALSITEVIGCLRDPGRAIGMHFFNPAHKMRLIEIVSGLQTRPETLQAAEAIAQDLRKETVRVTDSPGFATSRVNALIGNEALRMLESGVAAAEDIDKAVQLGLNHPMGPLEMGDLVGWDTRLQILEYLEQTLGNRFRPTNLHRRLVAAGHLGRKTGQGIYTYDGDVKLD